MPFLKPMDAAFVFTSCFFAIGILFIVITVRLVCFLAVMQQLRECTLALNPHKGFTGDFLLVLPEAVTPHAGLDELEHGAVLDFQVLQLHELVLDGILFKFLAVPVLIGTEPLERPAALDGLQNGEQ